MGRVENDCEGSGEWIMRARDGGMENESEGWGNEGEGWGSGE